MMKGRSLLSLRKCALMIILNLCLSMVTKTSAITGDTACGAFSAATFIGAAVGIYKYMTSPGDPCRNSIDLRTHLESQVYGQHLALNIVVRSIKAHFLKDHPSKVLVLSFHGSTGTGKNFIAQLVNENKFECKGVDNYRYMSGGKDFFNHELAEHYKTQIQELIETSIRRDPLMLFIFDEIEKMPNGTLDAIIPFVDHVAPQHDAPDYRNAVYILINNSGGKYLNTKTYEKRKNGTKREELEIEGVQSMLSKITYNEKGGLKETSLITKSLIDAYVPFLPLKKYHVKQCIERSYERGNFDHVNQERFDEMVDKIFKELEFFPPDVEIYCTTGCKQIAGLLAAYFE